MNVDDQPAEITAQVPLDSRYVSLIRVMATSLAADLEFSIDDIDDIRLAANELASTVIDWGVEHEASTLNLSAQIGADEIRLAIRTNLTSDAEHQPESEPFVDELARRILVSVVDEFEIEAGSGWIRKRRSEG